MTMTKILVTLVALLTFAAVPVSAQTYLTTTTLSNSITATQTQFTLASGTNAARNGGLYVDHEFIPIASCQNATCTIVNVVRANKPQAHAASAQVFVATVALKPLTMIDTAGGVRLAGQCSTSTSGARATALAAIPALPIIDIVTGDVYDCRRNGVGGSWVWNIINSQAYNGEAGSTWAQ